MTGGSEYVRSVFTVILPYCDRYFLWNTMSGSVKKLKAKNAASAVSEARELLEAVQSSPAAMSEWIDSGFFVPRDWDELDVIDEDLRADHAGGFFRIMTTGACNASCRYCYILTEAGHMTNSTAVRTAAFVADRYERDPYRMPPLIEWFGGEPLMNPESADTICRYLSERNIPFSSRITTNGSLWTEERIHTASRLWNLTAAQITLDGTAAAHESVKRLPPGSFDRIIWGIRRLIEEKIRVRIRINHFSARYPEEKALLDYLRREFSEIFLSAPEMLSVYVVPGYAAGICYPPETAHEVLALAHEAASLKAVNGADGSLTAELKEILPRRRHLACFACNPYNYTIAPDGKLYNCTHNMTEAQCVGSVWDISRDRDTADHADHAARKCFTGRKLPKACRACPLLPVCLGGCPAGRMRIAPMTQCCMVKSICVEINDL